MHNMLIPVLALRDLVILPRMRVTFDLDRDLSKNAAKYVLKHKSRIFAVCQKDGAEDYPETLSALEEYGCVCRLTQMVTLPDGTVRVVVEGDEAATINGVYRENDIIMADIESFRSYYAMNDAALHEALLRSLKEELIEYIKLNNQFSAPGKALLSVRTLHEFLEAALAQLPLSTRDCLEFISISRYEDAAKKLLRYFEREHEVLLIKNEIQSEVKERLDRNQKEYVLREQMRVIRGELGEDEQSEAEEFLEKTEQLDAPDEVKEKLKKEISRFAMIPSSSQEGTISRTYIETLLELPWQKRSEDSGDIRMAREILDRDHYGMEKIKERILEFLAVRTFTGEAGGSILCLVGPPGTGKTSIAKSVAEALNKKYVRISLGGVRDEAEIRGHRRTYIGALPGRIAAGLKRAGVCNPLMLLDEIDKTGSDYKGDVASALLEVLDSEQNVRFSDHYVEVPIDLSHVLFIATANSSETIPRPLLDRMEIIEVSGYTENEKFHIAKDYLLPKQLVKNGLTAEQAVFTDDAIRKLIHSYTREAGVRNLERKIGQVCRKAAMEILSDGIKSVYITEEKATEYLGKEIARFNPANEKNQTGIVRGLAWTAVGGDTLEVEVNIMPGEGKLQLTGQLGDIMKESAGAGLTFVRSVASRYGVDEEFFKKNDIHLHVPEGAVPKDGPSAGITMAVAILSAVSGRRVLADLAMTGEITLRGRVLPIGGLKEKLLAAKLAGIHRVIVPAKNARDIDELSAEITDGLDIHLVETMEEVIELSFEKEA
ncbi:MAG: endopeptidase La [Lachnospiraceae bacterium]|nr:endopeptidase La [Lachnospiraceae bacterium]